MTQKGISVYLEVNISNRAKKMLGIFVIFITIVKISINICPLRKNMIKLPKYMTHYRLWGGKNYPNKEFPCISR